MLADWLVEMFTVLLTFSCMTDDTLLCSRQPTQEELDEPPAPSPEADQLRRRLVRTAKIDLTCEAGECSARWGRDLDSKLKCACYARNHITKPSRAALIINDAHTMIFIEKNSVHT